MCLKDAGQLEEALETAQESLNNYERADDLLGLIKSLGNKGLIYLELENVRNPNKSSWRLTAWRTINSRTSPITTLVVLFNTAA